MASQSKDSQPPPTTSIASQSEESSNPSPTPSTNMSDIDLRCTFSLIWEPRLLPPFLPILLPLLIFCKLFWAVQTAILIVVCFRRSWKQKNKPQEPKDEELLQQKAELTPLPSPRRTPLPLKWVEGGIQKSRAQESGAENVDLHTAEQKLLETCQEFAEVYEATRLEEQVPSNITFKHPSTQRLFTTNEYVPPAEHVHLDKDVHTNINDVVETEDVLEFGADVSIEIEKSPRKQLLELGISLDGLDDIAEQFSSPGGWSNPKPLQSGMYLTEQDRELVLTAVMDLSNHEDDLAVLDSHTPLIFDEVDSFLSSLGHQGAPQTKQQNVSQEDSEFEDVPLDDESSPLATTRFSGFEKMEILDVDNFLDDSLVDGSTLVAEAETPSKQASFITTTKTIAGSEAAVMLKLDQIQPVLEVDYIVHNVQLEEPEASISHLDLSKFDQDVPSAPDQPQETIGHREQHLEPIAKVTQVEDTELSEMNPSRGLLQDVPSLTRVFKEINELLTSTQSLPVAPPWAKLPESIVSNESSQEDVVQSRDFTIVDDAEDNTHYNGSEVFNPVSEIPRHVEQVDEILHILAHSRVPEASPEDICQTGDVPQESVVVHIDESGVFANSIPQHTLPPNDAALEEPALDASHADLLKDDSRQYTAAEISEDRDSGLIKQGKEVAVAIWRDEEDEKEAMENADSVNEGDSGILRPIEGNEQRRDIATNAEETLVEEPKKKHSKSARRKYNRRQKKIEASKVAEAPSKPVTVSEAVLTSVTSQSSAAVNAEQAALGDSPTTAPEATPAEPEITEPTAAPSTDAQIKKAENKAKKSRGKANRAKYRVLAQLERILQDDENKAKSHDEIVSMLVRVAIPLDLEKIARFWGVDEMVRGGMSSSGSVANIGISMSTQVLDKATQHVQEPEFEQPLGMVEENWLTYEEPEQLVEWYATDEPVPGWHKLSPKGQFELVRQGGVPSSEILNEPFARQFWEVDQPRSVLCGEADVFKPYVEATAECTGLESEYSMTAQVPVNNFPPHHQAALQQESQHVPSQRSPRSLQSQAPTMQWSTHEDSSSSGYLGYHILPQTESLAHEANNACPGNPDPVTPQPAVNNLPLHIQAALGHVSHQIRSHNSTTNIQIVIPSVCHPSLYLEESHTSGCPDEYYIPPKTKRLLLEANQASCGSQGLVTLEPAVNNLPLHVQAAFNIATQQVRSQPKPAVNNFPLHVQAVLDLASQDVRNRHLMSNGQVSGYQHSTWEHKPMKQVRFIEEVELEQVQPVQPSQRPIEVNEAVKLIQVDAPQVPQSQPGFSVRFGQFPFIDIDEARKAGSCMPQVQSWFSLPDSSSASPVPAPFDQVDENEGDAPQLFLSLPRPFIHFGQFPNIDIKKARSAGSCMPQVKSWFPLLKFSAAPSQGSVFQRLQEPMSQTVNLKQVVSSLHSHRLGPLAQSIELEKRIQAAKPRRRSFHDWQSLHTDRYGKLDIYGEDGELCHENFSHENCEQDAWCWTCKKLLDGLVGQKEYAGEIVAGY